MTDQNTCELLVEELLSADRADSNQEDLHSAVRLNRAKAAVLARMQPLDDIDQALSAARERIDARQCDSYLIDMIARHSLAVGWSDYIVQCVHKNGARTYAYHAKPIGEPQPIVHSKDKALRVAIGDMVTK